MIAPGVYPALPEEVYRADPALGSTVLGHLLEAPAVYACQREHPTPPTLDMRVGSALHATVLGGPSVGVPDPDAGDTFGIEVTDAQAAAVIGMTLSVMAHPQAGPLINGGAHEVSAFRVINGVPCKARLDVYRPGSYVVDLKKNGKSAGMQSAARSLETFGYHRQAGHYLDVIGEDLPYYLIVVEDRAPYLVAVYEIDPEDIADGKVEAAEARAIWADCTATGNWPGLPIADPPALLRRPAWARAKTLENA